MSMGELGSSATAHSTSSTFWAILPSMSSAASLRMKPSRRSMLRGDPPQLCWKQRKRWSSWSVSKCQASFANRSKMFLTMASCWSICVGLQRWACCQVILFACILFVCLCLFLSVFFFFFLFSPLFLFFPFSLHPIPGFAKSWPDAPEKACGCQ